MKRIEAAAEAAKAGAEVLLRYWQILGKDDADLKARNDWVSRADRESEAAVIASLHDSFPEDAFLGEESGESLGDSENAEYRWIIDPLDGTSNYLQHFPFWCVSIGLRRGTETVAGLIYEPLRDQFFTTEKGCGAYRNGQRMTVSSHQQLEGSFLATGFPFRAQKFVPLYCQIFQDVISRSKGVRRAGSAALDLAYTAAGIFDGFFELHLAPWDVAAGALMVAEAGGVVTDFSGGQRFWDRGNVIGAPPGVHRELLELVARHTMEDQLDR